MIAVMRLRLREQHSCIPNNAHLQHVLNEGTTELTEIRIGHVIGNANNANQRFASNLTRNGNGLVD